MTNQNGNDVEVPKFYTLKQISKKLNVTERTLLSYLKSGKLKGQKIGQRWIISQRNLDDFIDGEQ
jgi:excisionase family DNA binding protein